MKVVATLFMFVLTSLAAGVPGKWIINAPREHGEMRVTLTIRAAGNSYSGTIKTSEGDEIVLQDVRVNDSELRFRVVTEETKYEVNATVEGDTMKGTFIVNNNPGGTFTGTRDTTSNP